MSTGMSAITRRLSALALLLGAAALTVAASPAASVTAPATAGLVADVPTVRATTVVRTTGTAGIRLEVPRDGRLAENDIRITTDGKAPAFIGLSDVDCMSLTPDRTNLCIQWRSFYMPSSGYVAHETGGPEDEIIAAGMYDLYIVSDAAVRVELTIADADAGTIELDATAQVDGVLEPLEQHCIEDPAASTDCLDGAYGGATRAVRSPAYVAAYAYAEALTATSAYATACLDPLFGDTPNGARSSQYGCPLLPTEPGGADGLIMLAPGSIPYANGGARRHGQFNHNPRGDVYAGFYAREQSPLGAGAIAAYGLWLNGGIEGYPLR
jgi:hypothetical protein